ncbi:Cadherin domain protein [Methanococcoides burtonii DSM 6242]|uniref:Cadherin domain protein n=1 Tax=Methanococcoides burtonii (strain DSM 6242 / NBRC 107633 / OCM 468 / ACE-M) TaxID=259564 RepID=Q12Z10_METBU|nr:Cadherin domain protein [Methanococcoides burtonii DSM 6242]
MMHNRFSRWGNKTLIVLVFVILVVLGISVQASVPSFTNLDNSTIEEQNISIMDNDLAITNSDGTGYGDGYIEFILSNSNSYDDFDLNSSSSPNSNGEISINGSDVFVGTGSGVVKIGIINATYDGQDGQKLRVDFVTETASLPTNNNFETGNMDGWAINSSISSIPDTPELRAVMYETVDGNPDVGGGYDFNNILDSASQFATADTDASQGTYSLKLSNRGTTNLGFGYIWGPSAISSNFSAAAGDRILFDWMATQTSDYYVAYAILIDNTNSETSILFADQGSSSTWQTQQVLVAKNSSDLQFKFILGSYDNSGGRAVGATMRIDNIRAQLLTDDIVSSLARSLTYNYTDSSPSGDVISGRTYTITVKDGDGELASGTSTLFVYGNAPVFNSADNYSVAENETSLALMLYDTQADNGDGGLNDSNITYLFAGGDGQSLFAIDSDDGEIRLTSLGTVTLDYEAKTNYTLQVLVTDQQAANNTLIENVTVNVIDANDPAIAASPLSQGAVNGTYVPMIPEFSWTFSDINAGDGQAAYQLLVSSSSSNLTSENGDMWDTGKLMSSSSNNITYNGSSLNGGQTYYWKVKLWDSYDDTRFYCPGQTFSTRGPSLILGNVVSIEQDWGINFNIDHSVTSTETDADNVNVTYNVPWLTGSSLGSINTDDLKWCNHTLLNSTVAENVIRVYSNTTQTSASNDSEVFYINITKRDIEVVISPSSQSIAPGATIWVSATVEGEYGETFIGNAVFLRDGIGIGTTQAVTDGNASFNTTESSLGTHIFSIEFYNTTLYHNTSAVSLVTVSDPQTSDNGVRVHTKLGQPSENVRSTVSELKHVMGGNKVEFTFSAGDAPVLGVSFDAKDNEGVVVASVQVLNEVPDDVGSPSGISYEFMSINVGSDGMISEHNADNIVINFKVSREWIKENNIDPSTIRLSRYHEVWQDLPSSQTRDDDEFLYFVAYTPGFSFFSIVGDEVGTSVSEEEVVITPQQTIEDEEPVEKDKPILAVFGIAIVLGMATVIVSKRNKK